MAPSNTSLSGFLDAATCFGGPHATRRPPYRLRADIDDPMAVRATDTSCSITEVLKLFAQLLMSEGANGSALRPAPARLARRIFVSDFERREMAPISLRKACE
jgi:hypothetical protein